MVFSVAFIGKNNEPLYFYSEEDEVETLNLQMIVHSSLDVIDERRKRSGSPQSVPFDLYLDLLLPIDEYKVFGYYSNTQTKTIVVCENVVEAGSSAMRDLVLSLHGLFVAAMQNPFQPCGRPLTSPKLHSGIQVLLSRSSH